MREKAENEGSTNFQEPWVRELGFSMDQVRELLSLADQKDRTADAIDGMARAHLDLVKGKMSELAALREELERLVHGCSHGRAGENRIIEALAEPRMDSYSDCSK